MPLPLVLDDLDLQTTALCAAALQLGLSYAFVDEMLDVPLESSAELPV